ncbi:hypothetical protein K8R33_03910 [archaeon]|nr:hypothetical protein [archaeon]
MERKPKSEWQSIRAKVKKENYLELVNYCDSSGITISSYVRSLIEKNNPAVSSIKKSGVNNFRFNPLHDKFLWEINFDDGSNNVIAEDLSDNFLENLKLSMDKALKMRREHIDKRINSSVVIPTKINKLKGRGENVKG